MGSILTCDSRWAISVRCEIKNFEKWENFWQFISYLAKCSAYFGNFDLNFIIANGQILKNNLTIWSHWTKVWQRVHLYWLTIRAIIWLRNRMSQLIPSLDPNRTVMSRLIQFKIENCWMCTTSEAWMIPYHPRLTTYLGN